MFPEPLYRHGIYRTTRHWRHRKERYRLVGSRCRQCGQLWWPGRDGKACGKCNARDFEDHEFTHEGKVYVYHPEENGHMIPPVQGFEVYGNTRIFAMIELPEGIFIGPTEIVDCRPDQIKRGMKVKMVTRKFRRESNGNWAYGFMWVPAQ